MNFEDLFKNEQVVLKETRVFEQPGASDFDKETRHVHRVVYQPEAFKEAFKDIIENDTTHKTATAKVNAIKTREPFWRNHISKITKS